MTESIIAAIVAMLSGLVTIAITWYTRRNAAADAAVDALTTAETDYENAVAACDLTRINLAGQRLRDARLKAGRDATTGL